MSGLAVAATALAVTTIVLAVRAWLGRGRVRALRAVAAAYATGRFDQRAPSGGVGGIAQLAIELNALGERLQAAMAEAERRRELLDAALGALSEGVGCIDRIDRVVYANPAWNELAGGGALTRSYYELLPNSALREPIAAAWSARRAASSVDFEHQHRHLRARIVRAGDDVVVLVLHDLTEIKRLEAARRDFMAAVSHEFKTPLTSILGFTETLLDEGVLADPANARTFIERISRHADRLASLVKDVLTLSRLEQGAWPLRPVACDLIDVANEVVTEFTAVAETATVTLTLDAPASVPLRTDPELVRQLVGNLVSNAIRYNRPQGSVTIRVGARADGQAVITVADTGIGIPAEHRERIFERFYRIDSHRSRQTGGTGLGLAIVKHLLQVLDGTVMLHSASDGTRFEVYLRDLSAVSDARVPGEAAAGT